MADAVVDPERNAGSFLVDRAREDPSKVAIRVGATGAAVSYGDLAFGAERAARALREYGVEHGDRVALALPSTERYLELYFACARTGAILVPLNTRLSRAELGFQLEDCRPKLVVHTADAPIPETGQGERITPDRLYASAPSPITPVPPEAPGGETPQILLYTSGTTGWPKGALLPHRKTLFNTLNAERYFGLTRADVVVAPVPLFHSFGLLILAVPTLYCGATLVLVDKFDPVGIQRTAREADATILAGVPVMFQRMLRAGLDREALASLRGAFSAGAPLDRETIRAFWEAGIPMQQAYGQTETSILCCLPPEQALAKAGSVGLPVHHGELRIVDASGAPVPAGTPGEIVVSGPIVMLGYWERPEETAASRLAGWHRTGDRGVMDAEGFVTLVGRFKDMYISGGENVYTAEVERVLEEHPAVSEAAVVGVPDPEWGESGRAYLVPNESTIDAQAVLAWLADRLARFKLPREVRVLEALPRTASGKVQKHRLELDR